jgi:hypothetical protein
MAVMVENPYAQSLLSAKAKRAKAPSLYVKIHNQAIFTKKTLEWQRSITKIRFQVKGPAAKQRRHTILPHPTVDDVFGSEKKTKKVPKKKTLSGP